MHRADWHRFYCLTKNPARYGGWDFPVGVWRGFTAENQDNYNTRLEYLPERNENFVSLEPLQGPVRIGKDDRVDWVIVGGETGNRKGRVIVPADWIAQVVDDCRAKGIPVYVKGQVPGNWPKEKPS
jgi:protein gp37